MKNRLFALIMTMAMCLAMLTGCTRCKAPEKNEAPAASSPAASSTVEEEPAPEESTAAEPEAGEASGTEAVSNEAYDKLIAAATLAVTSGEEQEGYDFSCMLHMAYDPEYETLGYLIQDLDGDGVEELLFGSNTVNADDPWDGVVYDIYTMVDGELVHVLDGWDRNRYYLTENGYIANEGSSGAANFNYSYFIFENGAANLVESVIYDGMKDEDNPWFYSTEQQYDATDADPISEDDAYAIINEYVYSHPVYTPFVA